MKIISLVTCSMLCAGFQISANSADLYDTAKVVFVQPVHVGNAPQRVCSTPPPPPQPVYVGQTQNVPANGSSNTNVTGVLVGGAAGGIIGNQIGKGNGKTAATAIGAVIGALSGNNIANSMNNQQPNQQPIQQVQQVQPQPICQYVSDGSTSIVGYDVAYEYAGKRASVRMPYNPGATVRIGISVVP